MIQTAVEDVKEVVEEIKNQSPYTRIFKDKVILWNTIMMMLIWCCSNFDYFVINNLLKKLPGIAYLNYYIADGAEIVANFLSLSLIQALGFKLTMMPAYTVALSGMIILAFIKPLPNLRVVSYIFIIWTKFGICSTYNLSYIGNALLFDPSILGTTIGLCTASSRLVNAGAQPVADIPYDKNMP